MAHLAINEEVKGLYHHVHVEDGYMLTYWNESDDPKDYQGCECLYMPLGDEYPDFRVITREQHIDLDAKAEALREAERNEHDTQQS